MSKHVDKASSRGLINEESAKPSLSDMSLKPERFGGQGRRRGKPAHKRGLEAHGVLLIDKPRGLSSFDVIRALRRATGIKKMGHTGTLDPMATGLLVICLGEATKLVPYLTADDKEYEAEVTFGVTTNTYDAEGDVTHRAPVEQLSMLQRVEVADALSTFLGRQSQRPPAFSAVRVDGQRLYEKARRGEAVEAPLRQVTFHQLELTNWRAIESETGDIFPRAEVQVRCSKGTYIRSLASDLGEKLECGAHLTALRRTQAGRFCLNEAHKLESITAETILGAITPLVEALPQAPRVILDSSEVIAILHGKQIDAPQLEPSEIGVYRGVSVEGQLIALLQVEGAHLKVARGFRG